jgi:tetratricopeptide (TPR) repeat protein
MIRLVPRSAGGWLTRGICYALLSDHKSAVRDFTTAVSLDGKTPYAYYLRALSHLANSDSDQALSDLTRAIKLRAEYGEALWARSEVYQSLGKATEAKADRARARTIIPAGCDERKARLAAVWRVIAIMKHEVKTGAEHELFVFDGERLTPASLPLSLHPQEAGPAR